MLKEGFMSEDVLPTAATWGRYASDPSDLTKALRKALRKTKAVDRATIRRVDLSACGHAYVGALAAVVGYMSHFEKVESVLRIPASLVGFTIVQAVVDRNWPEMNHDIHEIYETTADVLAQLNETGPYTFSGTRRFVHHCWPNVPDSASALFTVHVFLMAHVIGWGQAGRDLVSSTITLCAPEGWEPPKVSTPSQEGGSSSAVVHDTTANRAILRARDVDGR
jgi:hypothetical protein